MAQRINDPKPRPIEEWGAKEWETAYNNLNSKFEDVRKQLKAIKVFLLRAIARIDETID